MTLDSAVKNNEASTEALALPQGVALATAENPPKQRWPGFQPGRSGNPRGRPIGTYGRRINPLKRMLDFESKEILKKVVSEAKNGNMQAASLVLSRTMPRERLVHLKLPRITDAPSALQTLALVFECVSRGELTPSEADHISAMAKSYAEISELTAIKAQLAALEARVNGQ
jgi:hypothetical protein